MVDGRGDPNTAQSFKEAVSTLYSVSYNLKFACKEKMNLNYFVGPLEGLWWTDDMRLFSAEKKDDWKWTLMILQPEIITKGIAGESIETIKKKSTFDRFPKIRFERFVEGSCAQIMHVGPYAAEGPAIKTLHKFIDDNLYNLRGKHHEIYIGDPRKSAPEKLKTIIRQPIKN